MKPTPKLIDTSTALLVLFLLVAPALPVVSRYQEPATVTLENGRQYTGILAGLADERLALIVPDGAGEAEYLLPIEQITKVDLPDEDLATNALLLYQENNYEQAIPLLETIYRNRLPYLALLAPNQETPLVALVKLYSATGARLDAVITARRLSRDIRNPAHREELAAIKLTGYLDLDLIERAVSDGRAWCARQDRHPDSALGWYVLAEVALREERLEDALWIALQPIAFSSASPMSYLEAAYAAALRAYQKTGETDLGIELYREMRDRDLPLSELSPSAGETIAYFAELWEAERQASPNEEETGPLLDPRPPRADLNLPLREVRRLLLALPEFE